MIIINKPLLCLLGIVAVVGSFTTGISFEGKREVFSEAGAIQIEDDTKQIVSLPSVASRVVSISSADSELLIALGVSPVGVVNSRELPAEVQAKIAQYPNMNSAVSPSIERIIMSDPNLVIGICHAVSNGVAQKLLMRIIFLAFTIYPPIMMTSWTIFGMWAP